MLSQIIMPDTHIDITFLIVNYASRQRLTSLIDEIVDVTPHTYEIILINNDQEPLILNLPLVRVINAGKNIGFGRAHNRGAQEARGQFLCILNPDVHNLTPHFTSCIEYFSTDPSLGIIAPRILNTSDGEQEWSYSKHDITPLSLIMENLYLRSRSKTQKERNKRLAWVTGAVFFIPRNLFTTIGGFDEQFFLYYEDIDLCRRVRSAGRYITRDTDYSVTHISGASSVNTEKQKEAYFTSQNYYFTKYYGSLVAKVLQFLRTHFHTS